MDKSQYKGVFVFAEQREGVIQNVAFELIGKARELADSIDEQVTALLFGYQMNGQDKELIAAGADRVLVVDNKLLENYLTAPYAEALEQVINNYKPEIVLLGATTIGRDLGPRISARIQTGLTADCTALEIDEERNLLMTRPAFGGNLMATIICKNHRPQMSTVRPGVMRRIPSDPTRKGVTEQVTVSFDEKKCNQVRLVRKEREEKNLVDITEAHILVSGGRGV
ncbi:electron transfer flavoprotein subunit alpha/FixB family protein, partial [Bacteroides heparinolyticus]|uniref:electron transfer flavoprotein subunit alpha/FixB family protein n=1 Tax=Prevotella heparinolytica TaxID=28113 RepID=UPI0035A02694